MKNAMLSLTPSIPLRQSSWHPSLTGVAPIQAAWRALPPYFLPEKPLDIPDPCTDHQTARPSGCPGSLPSLSLLSGPQQLQENWRPTPNNTPPVKSKSDFLKYQVLYDFFLSLIWKSREDKKGVSSLSHSSICNWYAVRSFKITKMSQNDHFPGWALLQWRHNERDAVSNHRRLGCLLQQFVQAHTNKNIKAPRHWPLSGEFPGDRWIPLSKGQ